MQDQNQIIAEPQTTAPAGVPAKIVDVIAQPASAEHSAATIAAPDPELMSEPAVEPVPAPAPVETQKEVVSAQPGPRDDAKKQKAEAILATPKQPSTVPVGAILVSIIMFLALAAVALIAFRQGY